MVCTECGNSVEFFSQEVGQLEQEIGLKYRYLTTRQIGFFPDFDELYWNATGTGWAFTIDQAEARIALPTAVAFLRRAARRYRPRSPERS